MRAELEAAALAVFEAQLEAAYGAAMAERSGQEAPAPPALTTDPAL